MEMTIRLVQKGGFYEYFNPYTGKGCGSDHFSWTASLIIDMIELYKQMDEVEYESVGATDQ